MNTHVWFALCIGVLIGVGIMAVVNMRDPFSDPMGHFDGGLDRREHKLHADTVLLDYLEQSEYNVFFNDTIDAGMWGVIAPHGKMIAAGATVRSALHRSKEKDKLAGIDALDEALAS